MTDSQCDGRRADLSINERTNSCSHYSTNGDHRLFKGGTSCTRKISHHLFLEISSAQFASPREKRRTLCSHIHIRSFNFRHHIGGGRSQNQKTSERISTRNVFQRRQTQTDRISNEGTRDDTFAITRRFRNYWIDNN